jgi:hypothetical protein
MGGIHEFSNKNSTELKMYLSASMDRNLYKN